MPGVKSRNKKSAEMFKKIKITPSVSNRNKKSEKMFKKAKGK